MRQGRVAAELVSTNRERQNEENSIIEETYKKIESQEHDFERDRERLCFKREDFLAPLGRHQD